MTGGTVVVLGDTGRNFAAGMSGGVAYVYDPAGRFRSLANMAMIELESVKAGGPDETRKPRQRALGAHDAGMGDMLHFDAERLKILVERHKLYTGSQRATEILDSWDQAVTKFVKVMPKDYRAALIDMETERQSAAHVAAE
jgi:glutamate synthase (NADPH/NADH) large chain